MTFSELFSKVKKLVPDGFLSVEVEVYRHGDGEDSPVKWIVYIDNPHRKFFCGGSPEQALAELEDWLDVKKMSAQKIREVSI